MLDSTCRAAVWRVFGIRLPVGERVHQNSSCMNNLKERHPATYYIHYTVFFSGSTLFRQVDVLLCGNILPTGAVEINASCRYVQRVVLSFHRVYCTPKLFLNVSLSKQTR